MKNFTQKFIGLLTLMFATSFTVNAQCDETLVLTSQGGSGGGSYGNWAWFAGDLRLWLEEGDTVYAANGSAYIIGDEMQEYHYQNGVSQVWFSTNVAGVFTNGNSYNTNIASCTIEGCTESTAQNYMPNANTDDGSCIVYGCTDISSFNYNNIATIDDDSCIPIIEGCTSSEADNFDSIANTNDGSCVFCNFAWEQWNDGELGWMYSSFSYFAEIHGYGSCDEPEILGCTDWRADNYDYEANTDDGSCYRYGCMEEYANNYDQFATLNENCVFYGCTEPSAINYNSLATDDDGSCVDNCSPVSLLSQGGNGGGSLGNWAWFAANLTNVITTGAIVYGSNGVAYTIGGEVANHHYTNGISQVYFTTNVAGVFTNGNSYESTISYCSPGCTNPEAANFNVIFNVEDGSCIGVAPGCTNSSAVNYNEEANTDDGSCIIEGCTDIEAFNYNEQATENDGSCVAVINGCMDELSCNYNSEANTDDSSCYSAEQYYDCNEVCLNDSDQDGVCDEIEVVGCTDSEAFNYNDEATDDNGSCVAVVNGCMDSSMSNYNSEANTEDSSCISWEELANSLQSELDNVVPEDGVSQEDVDAAYVAGAASVQVPECEEVATENIPLDLPQGWSMFGYTCLESLDVVESFSDISDNIEIVKDEWGLAYLPSWGFSAFDNLEFGEGYQIKMIEEVTDFQFCTTIAGGTPQEDLDAAIAEVHAMYEGWCESDLDNDGICDVDEISGCMDASSCNYVSEAEFDDGSCDYESCLDVCGVINGDNSSCTDCAGIVNGTSEDFGCGCGVPAASAGYDCDGNQLPDNDDIWISIGLPGMTCAEVAAYVQNYMNSSGLGSNHPCETTLDWLTYVNPGLVGAPLFDFCPATCYNLTALEGCTDAEALNYNPSANVDDGSCILAYGDVTSDGTLNVGDVVLLAKAILNNDDIGVSLSGDTNQDGEINMNDVLSLFNEILNDESSGYPTAQENANINLSFENGTLYYESNVEIYGFQFSTNEPSEFFVSSEVEATFYILSSDNTTLGFSFAATYLDQTGETPKPLGSFEGITGLYEDAFAGFLFVDQFGATIPYNINFP